MTTNLFSLLSFVISKYFINMLSRFVTVYISLILVFLVFYTSKIWWLISHYKLFSSIWTHNCKLYFHTVMSRYLGMSTPSDSSNGQLDLSMKGPNHHNHHLHDDMDDDSDDDKSDGMPNIFTIFSPLSSTFATLSEQTSRSKQKRWKGQNRESMIYWSTEMQPRKTIDDEIV